MKEEKTSGSCCGSSSSSTGGRVRASDAMESEDIREHVRSRYARIAEREAPGTATGVEFKVGEQVLTGSSCCGDQTASGWTAAGYGAQELTAIPEGADLGLGCGHPTALGCIAPGETVLDLGSGAGVDCFLAARAVGPEGRVIGVDMTPAMVSRARRNAAGRFPNVEFRLGEIEHLPIGDAEMDVALSNCVINLVPDKRAAFAEIRRVLKPGGRAYISDIVLLAPLPEAVRKDPDAIACCIGGAVLIADYKQAIEGSGLQIESFTVRGSQSPPAGSGADAASAVMAVARSADIVLRKPR